MTAVDTDNYDTPEDTEARQRAAAMLARAHAHKAQKGWTGHELKAALGTDQMATIPTILQWDSNKLVWARLNHFWMDLTNDWVNPAKGGGFSLPELVERCERLMETMYDDAEAERRIAVDTNVRFVREVDAFAREHSIAAVATFSCGMGGVRGRAISCRTRAACDLLQERFPDEEVWMVEPL